MSRREEIKKQLEDFKAGVISSIEGLWGLCTFPGNGDDLEEDWKRYEEKAVYKILYFDEFDDLIEEEIPENGVVSDFCEEISEFIEYEDWEKEFSKGIWKLECFDMVITDRKEFEYA